MTIHIGTIIRDMVRAKGIEITAFADKINYTRRNVYKIFSKQTIDTGLLQKISKVLGENLFFNYLSDEEIAAYKNNKVKAAEVLNALKDLKATMIALDEKKDMAKRVKAKRKKYKNK